MRPVLAIAIAVLLTACGCPRPPPAKPPEPVDYQKTTVYHFEDDTIEGDLQRPDEDYVNDAQHSHEACQDLRVCVARAESEERADPAAGQALWQRVVELATPACDQSDPLACQVLSDLARRGKDPAAADRYHQRACAIAPDQCATIKTGIRMEE